MADVGVSMFRRTCSRHFTQAAPETFSTSRLDHSPELSVCGHKDKMDFIQQCFEKGMSEDEVPGR